MTSPAPAPVYLRPNEAAAYLRVSRATIYRWIGAGLPKIKRGSIVVLRRDHLDAWLAGSPLPT